MTSYRLLEAGETIQSTDERLRDSCEEWRTVKHVFVERQEMLLPLIGQPYDPITMNPIRRPVENKVRDAEKACDAIDGGDVESFEHRQQLINTIAKSHQWSIWALNNLRLSDEESVKLNESLMGAGFA